MTVSEILSNIIDYIKTGIPNNVKSANVRALLTGITKRMDVQEVGRLRIVKAPSNTSIDLEVGDRVTGIVEDTFIQGAIYLGGSINLLSSFFIITNTGGTSNPRENTYPTVQDMLDDQANQTEGLYQQVNDASDDPTVSEGKAIYVYLGTTDEDLDDYIRLSDAEVNAIEYSNHRTFTVKDLAESIIAVCPIGNILIKKNASNKVVGLLFDSKYTQFLDRNKTDLDAGDAVYIQLDNKTQLKRAIFKVTSIDYSDGTDTYYIATVTAIEASANFEVGDLVEVFVRNDNNTGSGGTSLPDLQAPYTTALVFDRNRISTFGDATDNSHDQTGAITLTYDFTNAVEGVVRTLQINSNGDDIVLPTQQNKTGFININSNTLADVSGNKLSLQSGKSYLLLFFHTNGYVNCVVIDAEYIETDLTPPTFSTAPNALEITSTSFDVQSQLNENGNVYLVVVADGATAPTSIEVKAGTGSSGSGEIANGSASDIGTGTTISITLLTDNTAYDVYVVAEDTLGNLQASPTLLNVSTLEISGGDISVYRFQDNVNDSVGTNNGTATAIAYVAGKINKAAVFNGSTSRVVIPDADNLSFGSGPYTISGWYTFTTKVASQWLLSKRGSADNKEYNFLYDASNLLIWAAIDESNGGNRRTQATFNPVIDTWYHFAVTCAGGTAQPKLYINGVDLGVASNTGTYVNMQNGNSDLALGTQSWNLGTSNHHGKQDSVRFKDIELSPAEVTDLYNLENAGTEV